MNNGCFFSFEQLTSLHAGPLSLTWFQLSNSNSSSMSSLKLVPYRNVNEVKGHPSIKEGGCHEVQHIEDLVKIGQIVKGCSYFAARSMAQDTELVFCSYNYVINPNIVDAMEIDISGSIIILDEVHNIEDIARDAGGVDLDEEALLYRNLKAGMTYQPLFEMTQDILSWMSQRKKYLSKL